jgi:hypothetical protein
MPVLLGPPKKNSVYVITIDNTTGALVKIETLGEDSSKRKELSAAQYAQVIASCGAMGLPLATGIGRYASSPLYGAMSSSPYAYAMAGYPYAYAANGNPAVQAYFRGMMDYLQQCVGE